MSIRIARDARRAGHILDAVEALDDAAAIAGLMLLVLPPVAAAFAGGPRRSAFALGHVALIAPRDLGIIDKPRAHFVAGAIAEIAIDSSGRRVGKSSVVRHLILSPLHTLQVSRRARMFRLVRKKAREMPRSAELEWQKMRPILNRNASRSIAAPN